MRNLVIVLAVVGLGAGLATAQYPMVNDIPGTWIDISGTGTPLNPGDDTSHPITSGIGNLLVPTGTLFVASNGNFGLTSFTTWTNTPIPAAGFYGGGRGFAPFWDDLHPRTIGNIYWQQLSDRLIIQWHNMCHFSGPIDNGATFQVQVFPEGGGPGYVQYLYQDMVFGNALYDYGASATVGYQTNATTGVQWSYNQAVITDGLVLTIVPEPASLLLLGLGALALRRR